MVRLAADRIGSVDGAGRVDKKAGPGKFAVFVDGVNLDHGAAATLEDGLDLAADGAGGVFLGRKERQTNESD